MPQTVSERLADTLRRESRSLVAFLTMLTGSRPTADDLFQETCLEAWRLRDRLEADAEVGCWLRAIARYQALRYFRRQSRSRMQPLSPDLLDRFEADWSALSAAAEVDRRPAALAYCLETLTPDQRSALSQRYSGNRSFAAIGRATGRTESAVKMWLSRLRQKLYSCIQRRLREEDHDG